MGCKNTEVVAEGLDEVRPGDPDGVAKVRHPPLAGCGGGNLKFLDDLIEFVNHDLEGRTAVGIWVPASSDQVLKSRICVSGDWGTSSTNNIIIEFYNKLIK